MPEDAKFIATLLSRSPLIAARLEEVQITDDVINRKILSRKKTHFGGTSYGDAPVAQIDAVTNTPIPTHNPSFAGELHYLPKGKMEDPSEYTKRINMTPFFPQTPKILNERQGAIFSEPPELVGTAKDDPGIKEFFERATATRQSFMWCCVQVADFLQRHGCVALLVDREPLPQDVAGRTVTEEEKTRRALGAPKCAIYSLQNVLDAEWDREGLVWIKLLEEQTTKPTYDAKPVTVKTVRIIDRTVIHTYRVTADKTYDDVGTIAHGTPGRVPVKLGKAFGDQEDKLGQPALQEVAEADVASTRMLSDIIWNLFILGNPLLAWQTSRKDDELEDVVKGRYIVLKGAVGNQEPEDMRYIQLDGTGINLMFTAYNGFRNTHSPQHAAQGVRTNSGPTEASGISRAWKFKTSEERILFCLTRALEEIFNDVLDMVAEILGIDPDSIAVKFNEKFDIGQPQNALLVTQGVLTTANKFGLPALSKACLKSMVPLIGQLSTEDIEEIEEEIDALPVQAPVTVQPEGQPQESSPTATGTAGQVGGEEDEVNEDQV